ncbi:soma ferritin-like [Ornithodoros turicata]|uniref:soma ferritin-like n=1 Tax=Ornithodoros turicata TaxID=34597 RepID=UPI0031386D33
MATAQPRQNYPEECENLINKQINMELYANYVYLSMAYYFDRDDVALPGLFEFFKNSSDEEVGHAEKFMRYQNMRGGRIVLYPIEKPAQDDWESPLHAIQASLALEKKVNQALLDLYDTALRLGDAQLCDFLQVEYLNGQVRDIKELSDYVTNLERVGTGLGEFIFDRNAFSLKGTGQTED